MFSTSTYIIGDLTATSCQTPLDLTNVIVDGTTTLSSTCDATTDTDGDTIPDHEDLDDDNDGMSDDYEMSNGFDLLDASDADEDADGDGYTNLEEYQSGTDPKDASSNSFSLKIVGQTKYCLNSVGSIVDRHYYVSGTYDGSTTLLYDGVTDSLYGDYDIVGNVLTLERVTPTINTLIATYLTEVLGVMNFNISVDGGTAYQSSCYDTAQERDTAAGISSNPANPALIMYLLN